MLDRNKPPVISDEIKFVLPKEKKIKTENGIKTYFVEKNSLPIVVLNFILNKGSLSDPENKHGLATLTGLAIDEGANGFNALEIDSMLESLGSEFNITVDHDYISFSLISLTKNFERSLEIASWILQKPNFEKSDFEREKEKHINKLIKAKDDPAFLADWALGFYLNGNSPYKFPNIGISKDIANITLDDVKSFYSQFFSPENFSLIGIGNLSEIEFGNLIEKYFGNWETRKSPDNNFEFTKVSQSSKLILVDKPGTKQSEIRIGNFATNRKSHDYFAKKILNSILGGQFSSRLNRNLREEKGITYGVHTNFDYNLNYGYFEASTSVAIEHTKLALSEFSKEFNLIREKIYDDEIAFAKSYLKKIFPSRFETFSQLASNFSTRIIYDLADNYFEKFITRLNSVNKDEILNAAENNILPSQQITVVTGDVEIFGNQLKELFKNYSDIITLSLNELEI